MTHDNRRPAHNCHADANSTNSYGNKTFRVLLPKCRSTKVTLIACVYAYIV